MEEKQIIDILKILIPVLISSGCISFYYSKKLKRISSYESALIKMTGNLLEGMEQIHNRASLLATTVNEAEILIDSVPINLNNLKSNLVDIEARGIALKESINTHRIYITPIVSFGDSSQLFNSINSIALCISTLIDFYAEMSIEDKTDNIDILKNEFLIFYKIYDELRKNIKKITKKLNSGTDIF